MIRKPIIFDDNTEKTARINNYNKRLKIIMIFLMLASLIVVSLYFYNIWHKENQAVENRLETFTELRFLTLFRFLSSLSQETVLWAGHENVSSEASQYFNIWDQLTDQERKALRSEYIDGKENTTASDIYLNYKKHHDKYHENRQSFMHHHGYYDVFYFNLKGDLVYTVEKETDFGLNFDTDGSQFADTGLGEVFRKARDMTPGTSEFYDFTPYEPSNGAPASFFAAPIFDLNNNKIGVYAIQISVKKFDDVLHYSSGLGKTGETYVVGQDLLMRNNSHLSEKPTMLVRKIDTPAVRDALSGKSVLEKGRNTHGEKTLVAAHPLEFNGTKWAIVTEVELSELRAPFIPYIWFYLIAVTFIFAFGFIQYYLLTQKTSS